MSQHVELRLSDTVMALQDNPLSSIKKRKTSLSSTSATTSSSHPPHQYPPGSTAATTATAPAAFAVRPRGGKGGGEKVVRVSGNSGGESGGAEVPTPTQKSPPQPLPPALATAAATPTPAAFSPIDSDLPLKRTVCDNCRQRRVRCDGEFPCKRCTQANLPCKRDHVPRKRGPKPGHGKVIDGIRSRVDYDPPESCCATPAPFHGMNPAGTFQTHQTPYPTATVSPPPTSWCPPLPSSMGSGPGADPQSPSPFSSDSYRPTSRQHFDLIPQLVELYYDHIYPIMPLVYIPSTRETLSKPMSPPQKRHIYSLCALTAFHMSGKNMNAVMPSSWEAVGRFFLDESISARQSYDFENDFSLPAIIASFWTSTSFFEINQSQKSWYYLREALALALDLGLDNEAKYAGLSAEIALCRRRVFWILFVTERSFAILRRKPLTFTRTPSLPSTLHPYENPEIHAGFLKLIFSYVPLNSAFVNAWNEEETDAEVSKETYQSLQIQLDAPPTSPLASPASSPGEMLKPPENPEPTDIQKADLLITQQWLRLVVWQSSLRHGLLSTHAPQPSMRFSFPMSVAHDTVRVLRALPPKAVEVHGMGIFEKIFEIGSTCVSVMGACERTANSSTGNDLEIFSPGRQGLFMTDPVEFFVKSLSASPNSRQMFADRLLMLAREKPAAMKFSLSPGLGAGGAGGLGGGVSVKTETGEPHGTEAAIDMTTIVEKDCQAPGVPGGIGVRERGESFSFAMANIKIEPRSEEEALATSLLRGKTERSSSSAGMQRAVTVSRKRPANDDNAVDGDADGEDESMRRASEVCYMDQFQSYLFGDKSKA